MRRDTYKLVPTRSYNLTGKVNDYLVSALIDGMQVVLDEPTDYGHDLIIDDPRSGTRHRIAFEVREPGKPEPVTSEDVLPDDMGDLLAALMYGELSDRDLAEYL